MGKKDKLRNRAKNVFVEDVDYAVTLVIRLSTRVSFAPMEREGRITKFDAIENAWGQMPDDVRKQIEDGFGGEFDVDFDTETERLD